MLDLNPPEWLNGGPLPNPDAYGFFMPCADVSAADHQPPIVPSPFSWRNPTTIPPREWLYGSHLIRKYVSATIAPGGVGKSTLTISDALAMACGKDLMGVRPYGRSRVWVWNGEDPLEEIERRVVASMLYHGIEPAEVEGRLWLDSGRDTPIKVSEEAGKGLRIATPVIDALIRAISERQIDVLMVDPFVSVHGFPENDNAAMDAAVKAFAYIADQTGCAVELIHHSRKLNGTEADIDAARGGSAIAAAVRAARVLNIMSAEAAKGFGFAESDRRSFVRVDNAKANLAPPSSARWVKLIPQPLGNATAERHEDIVAVAESWTPPDAMEGITAASLLAVQEAVDQKEFRENVQAANWVGHEIGRVLNLNSNVDPERQKIKYALRTWLASGALVVQKIKDKPSARVVKIIAVGEWAHNTL